MDEDQWTGTSDCGGKVVTSVVRSSALQRLSRRRHTWDRHGEDKSMVRPRSDEGLMPNLEGFVGAHSWSCGLVRNSWHDGDATVDTTVTENGYQVRECMCAGVR